MPSTLHPAPPPLLPLQDLVLPPAGSGAGPRRSSACYLCVQLPVDSGRPLVPPGMELGVRLGARGGRYRELLGACSC